MPANYRPVRTNINFNSPVRSGRYSDVRRGEGLRRVGVSKHPLSSQQLPVAPQSRFNFVKHALQTLY